MNRNPVTSSQVKSIGYDPLTKTLHVEFKPFKNDVPNPVYEYANVTPDDYEIIMGAKSIGREINQRLKRNPEKYPYRKLSAEELAASGNKEGE